MYSIRELYRIGCGSSSSHTMGPASAATLFRQHFPQAPAFRVHLFGSLAATGKGHFTNIAVESSFAPLNVSFIWRPDHVPAFHPNGMRMEALDSSGQVIGEWEVFSVGGGALQENTENGWLPRPQPTYDLTSMDAILRHCAHSGQAFWEWS